MVGVVVVVMGVLLVGDCRIDTVLSALVTVCAYVTAEKTEERWQVQVSGAVAAVVVVAV